MRERKKSQHKKTVHKEGGEEKIWTRGKEEETTQDWKK